MKKKTIEILSWIKLGKFVLTTIIFNVKDSQTLYEEERKKNYKEDVACNVYLPKISFLRVLKDNCT